VALTFQCSTAVCMTLAGVPLSASMMPCPRRPPIHRRLSRRPCGGRLGGLPPASQPVAQRLDPGRRIGLGQWQPQQSVHPVVAPGSQRSDGLGFVASGICHHADHQKRCGR
jgi:hypothetical protein